MYIIYKGSTIGTKHIHKSQQNSFLVQVLPIQNGNMKTINEANLFFFFRMSNYETTKQKSHKQNFDKDFMMAFFGDTHAISSILCQNVKNAEAEEK